MNGPQDMGGMMGFGPVVPEADEPVFHAGWEARAFALTLAMGGTGSWTIDASRHARERLAPLAYWSSSYYEIWFAGLIKLLSERGLVTADEVRTGKSVQPPGPVARVLKAETIAGALARGGPANRAAPGPARFKTGDKIRTRNIHPEGHTRLPRYARGHVGEIVRIHGCHVFPDAAAHGRGDDPHWLYTVKFSARELWGHDERNCVHIDLWEPYLEALA
ncbi:MAG: nitrile hydratase subunit beta [Hyphomicrobiales bacterium]